MQDAFAEKYLSMAPYQYGANNPVRFIDINGDSLELTGSVSALNAVNTENQHAMDDLWTTEADASGNTTLLPLPNVGSMSESAVNFKSQLETIINDPQTTSINVVENSQNVPIGNAKTATIDIGDIQGIGNQDVLTKGGMLIHEYTEQSVIQTKFNAIPNSVMSFESKATNAHFLSAIPAENKINGSDRGLIDTNTLNPQGTGSIITNYTRQGQTTTIAIDYVNNNPFNVIQMK